MNFLYSKENFILFFFAILIDLIFGEFPQIIHPVCKIGFVGKTFFIISMKLKKINNEKILNFLKFIFGATSLLIEIFFWIFFILLLINISNKLNNIFKNYFSFVFILLIKIFFLKSSFAIKSLYIHVKNCATENFEKLKSEVSKIVSRNTSNLTKGQLYSAALESLSENFCDSIVAPLFYYIIFGFYGSFIYRVINTYDALFGYRNEKFEYFGKFCAKLDDIINFIPARLSAIFIMIFNIKNSFYYIKKYGGIKINGTYPMSAFAGILNVSFEKPGVYKFEGNLPTINDLKKGLKYYKKITFAYIIFLTIILLFKR